MPTDKQLNLIDNLLNERDIFNSEGSAFDPRLQGEHEYRDQVRAIARGLSVQEASKWIDKLLTLPRWQSAAEKADVPAGRYAIVHGGVVKFYRVDRPTEGRWAGYTFVKVQVSDDFYPVPREQRAAVLAAILEEGVQEAMLRYGREIGSCGHCGRTLTNEESREIGIGPVCRAKMGW